MNLVSIAKKVEKFVVDNSPAILTVIGVTGTITTSYLTGVATFKAAEIIRQKEVYLENEKAYKAEMHDTTKNPPFELKEKFQLVWKTYIPAAGTGILTIVCIIFADRISTRRAAAVAAAYSISEKAFSEYKDKVVEKIGENKEQKIRDEIAQDRIDRNPVSGREVFITGEGEVLCYEPFTDRYFKSSMEELRRAQNDINYMILTDSYARLSDFYASIGISKTSYSDEVGWNMPTMLELDISAIVSDDNRPCLSIAFNVTPVRDYYTECKAP